MHVGAVDLTFRDGRWSAWADMVHMYSRCRIGLIANLRFLKRLYDYVCVKGKAKGGKFKVWGVGKAADDDLYVYGVGEFPGEFEGFRVNYVEVKDPEVFERLRCIDPVPEDIIEEALREPEEKILPYQQNSLDEF